MESGEQMKQKITREGKSYYSFSFFAILIAAVFTLCWFLLIPADPKNAFLFGFSKERLVMLLAQLLFSIGYLWVAWKVWRDDSYRVSVKSRFVSKEHRIFVWNLLLIGILFVASTFILCPSYVFGNYAAIAERLRPFTAFLLVMAFHGRLTLLKFNEKLSWEKIKSNFLQYQSIYKKGMIVFAGCLIVGLFIANTGVGVKGTWTLWNEAGIPMLAWQIWIVLWIVFAGRHFSQYMLNKRRRSEFGQFVDGKKDLILSIGVFLLAFGLWSSVPTAYQYFSPGPYPPDYQPFPYADAAKFDIQSQFTLIGQGFANGNIGGDHIGYAGFLAILHLLAGQNFAKIITLQILIFAVFPVILYFLGKIFRDRSAGLFLALLSVLHQYTTIAAGTTLNTSHAANLLTEFPTGILLASLTCILVKWLREPKSKNLAYALPVGAILGLLILVRLNTLLLPFALFFFLVIVFWKDWRRWLQSIFLIILAMGIVLAPISIANGQRTGDYFFFLGKPKWYFGEVFGYEDSVKEKAEYVHLATFQQDDGDLNLSVKTELSEGNQSDRGTWLEGSLGEIGNYLLHNVVTSVLILPNSPVFHDFQHVVFQNLPYWNKLSEPWQGEMTGTELFGLGLNLLILSLGMGAAWKKWRWAGFVPLGIFLAYNFSTAIVGTAGGRYVTPTIWVILLYYVLGLLQILDSFSFGNEKDGLKTTELSSKVFSFRKGFFFFLPALLFSIGIVMLDSVFPQRYFMQKKDAILETIQDNGLSSKLQIDLAELETFLKDPRSVAYHGLGLNPRFYQNDEGEHSYGMDVYQARDYARLAFTLIGPFGTEYGILPMEQSPSFFPNASDVIVIGCTHKEKEFNTSYVDAAIIILLNENGNDVVYQREPWLGLRCESIETGNVMDKSAQVNLISEEF